MAVHERTAPRSKRKKTPARPQRGLSLPPSRYIASHADAPNAQGTLVWKWGSRTTSNPTACPA